MISDILSFLHKNLVLSAGYINHVVDVIVIYILRFFLAVKMIIFR